MTPGESRTAAEKVVDEAVLARVKRGIALLQEKFGPDFATHIDLDALDLRSADRCVLGQLYSDAEVTSEQWEELEERTGGHFERANDGYSKGLAILDGDVPLCPEQYGFDRYAFESYEELDALWADEIRALR